MNRVNLCERARFWASLRLDGELSQLEGALLDAHVARCAGCQAVAEGFGASTSALRSATLEHVAPVAIDLPRSPRRLLASVAVAAVLVLGVIAGGFGSEQGVARCSAGPACRRGRRQLRDARPAPPGGAARRF